MIRKLIFILYLVLYFLLLPKFCFAQSLEGATSFIRSPYQLSKWLLNEFRYEWELPDYWQKAQETLNLKKGDCEDFAILSQEILKGLGINSDILIIKFKNLKQSHAICMFKDDGYYSFLSNQKLIQTKTNSIKDAIQKEYPDWERIIFTNSKRQYIKIVNREKQRDSLERDLAVSLR